MFGGTRLGAAMFQHLCGSVFSKCCTLQKSGRVIICSVQRNIAIQRTLCGIDELTISDQNINMTEPALSNDSDILNYTLSSEMVEQVKTVIDTKLHQPGASTLTDLVQFSPDLQKLVALGVSLRAIEAHEGAPDLLANIKYFPQVHDIVTLFNELGVEDVGSVITKCPLLLAEKLVDIRERILYLSSKHFTRTEISDIVIKCPKWLLEGIAEMDARLGAVQKIFKLSGADLRIVATKSPRVILYNMLKLKKFAITLRHDCALDEAQTRLMVTRCPSLALTSIDRLLKRLDYLTQTMNVSIDQIIKWPSILRSRERKLQERHSFLQHLNLAQYDSDTPNYISLQRLVSGRDELFCAEIAQIPLERYYDFVKTL